MKMKWVINTTAIALLIFVAFLGLAKHDSVIAAQDEESKIEGLLLNRFTTDGNADFIVRFTEQADLSSAYSMEWNARGEFVYNTLRETATRSQANTIAILNGSGYKKVFRFNSKAKRINIARNSRPLTAMKATKPRTL